MPLFGGFSQKELWDFPGVSSFFGVFFGGFPFYCFFGGFPHGCGWPGFLCFINRGFLLVKHSKRKRDGEI